jgi:predicted nucleotidyltransferase
MVPMAAKAIVNIVRRYLAEVERAGIPVFAGILHGSYARGNARKDSDIDLLVISKDAGRAERSGDAALLWQLRGLIDYRIEPLLVGLERWRRDDGSPILATIRQEGLLIPPRSGHAARRRTIAGHRSKI